MKSVMERILEWNEMTVSPDRGPNYLTSENFTKIDVPILPGEPIARDPL